MASNFNGEWGEWINPDTDPLTLFISGFPPNILSRLLRDYIKVLGVEDRFDIKLRTETEHLQDKPRYKTTDRVFPSRINSPDHPEMSDYDYLTFETPEAADNALRILNGKMIEGKPLTVRRAARGVVPVRVHVNPQVPSHTPPGGGNQHVQIFITSFPFSFDEYKFKQTLQAMRLDGIVGVNFHYTSSDRMIDIQNPHSGNMGVSLLRQTKNLDTSENPVRVKGEVYMDVYSRLYLYKYAIVTFENEFLADNAEQLLKSTSAFGTRLSVTKWKAGLHGTQGQPQPRVSSPSRPSLPTPAPSRGIPEPPGYPLGLYYSQGLPSQQTPGMTMHGIYADPPPLPALSPELLQASANWGGVLLPPGSPGWTSRPSPPQSPAGRIRGTPLPRRPPPPQSHAGRIRGTTPPSPRAPPPPPPQSPSGWTSGPVPSPPQSPSGWGSGPTPAPQSPSGWGELDD